MNASRTPQIRYSTREFLAVLVLLFVSAPFVEEAGNPRLFFSILLTMVLVSAGFAVRDPRVSWIWAVAGAVPAILLLWAHHLFPTAVPQTYAHVLSWLFTTWVSLRLFRHVLQARKVDGSILSAAVATYLLAALAFALAHIVVGDVNPEAFAWTTGPASSHRMEGFTALYFSITTISTVAYGDVMPLSPPARLLAMVEAVSGMLYMTLLVARLVSVYASGKASGLEEPDDPARPS